MCVILLWTSFACSCYYGSHYMWPTSYCATRYCGLHYLWPTHICGLRYVCYIILGWTILVVLHFMGSNMCGTHNCCLLQLLAAINVWHTYLVVHICWSSFSSMNVSPTNKLNLSPKYCCKQNWDSAVLVAHICLSNERICLSFASKMLFILLLIL